ncbi:MAG: HNH endonuclease [Chloroflexota bacterium]
MLKKLSAPVLVLNANYEPLNICTTRRALGLIFSDKASLITNGRGKIYTVSDSYPAPSIIRIGFMVKRPRPEVKLSNQEVFRSDNYTCQYCGKRTKNLTIDHIIPKRLNGAHSWNNLVTACPPCNHKKGGRTNRQANMKLLSKPNAPTASAAYIFGRYLQNNEEWLPFVEGW